MKPMTLEDSKAGGGRALKGWACQLCGYFTKHRHHCTEHMYNRHAKPEHLPCPFCGKVFTKRPAHRLHKLKCSKKHQNAYNWILNNIVICKTKAYILFIEFPFLEQLNYVISVDLCGIFEKYKVWITFNRSKLWVDLVLLKSVDFNFWVVSIGWLRLDRPFKSKHLDCVFFEELVCFSVTKESRYMTSSGQANPLTSRHV